METIDAIEARITHTYLRSGTMRRSTYIHVVGGLLAAVYYMAVCL